MLKIVSCQFSTCSDISQNIDLATDLIRSACLNDVDLVLLPEIFCLPPFEFDRLADVAETYGTGPLQKHFSSLAKELNVWISAGSIPLISSDGRLTNSAMVYDRNGEEVLRYDKIHLFSYDGTCEATVYEPGKDIGCFDFVKGSESYRIGLAICFDLRFPTEFSEMNRPDLVLIPSAFTTPTGRLHWKTLLKARAIENQCYICASNQAKPLWGHSMIIDPWGKILKELDHSEKGFIVSTLDKDLIGEVRSKIPMFKS